MNITKNHLDKRICDCEDGADNTETYREFIRSSEEEFDIPPHDIDGMNSRELNTHFSLLDYLWEK